MNNIKLQKLNINVNKEKKMLYDFRNIPIDKEMGQVILDALQQFEYKGDDEDVCQRIVRVIKAVHPDLNYLS